MRNAFIITFKDHLTCRWLFRKKQTQSVRLTTQATLRIAIMRANYLAIDWNNDIPPDPQLPLSQNFGWMLDAEGDTCNKKNNNKKTKLFLLRDIFKERKSQGDFNNLDLWLSDHVLGSDH